MFSLFFIFFKIRYNSEKLTNCNTMTYYLGIMSGTSLDGVDIVLTDIQSNQTKLIAANFTPMPANLREKVAALIQSGETSLQALGELDHQFGLLYADCVNDFYVNTS